MNNEEILEQLIKVKNKINLFDDLTDYQIKVLVNKIVFKKYAKGEIIFRKGEDKNLFIFYVHTGSVRVCLNDNFGIRKTIATVPSGSIIGEIQAVVDNKRIASCIADSDLNILIGFTIKEYNLKSNGSIFAVFYRNLSRILASKIDSTNEKIK